MALRGKVVDLVGLDELDNANQIRRIGHVTVVQLQPGIGLVGILVKMVDAIRIEERSAALDAMHFVTLGQQEFSEVGAVLTGYPSNQRAFPHGSPLAPTGHGTVLKPCRSLCGGRSFGNRIAANERKPVVQDELPWTQQLAISLAS